MINIDKLKLIFKKIVSKMGFFMTSDDKQQKNKFLKEMTTHSEEMQDKLEPIPCPRIMMMKRSTSRTRGKKMMWFEKVTILITIIIVLFILLSTCGQ